MNMGQKEKLAIEYIELKKEFDGSEFKENLRANQIWWLVKEFKVVDLKDKIEAVKSAIKEREKKLKIERYYDTPAGSEKKAELESKKDAKHNEYRELFDNTANKITEFIKSLLGNDWEAVSSMSGYGAHIEVGLKNRDPKRNYAIEFGHDFDIYCNHDLFKENEFSYEINYGSLGSFKPTEDNYRVKFLLGLGQFSADNDANIYLKNLLVDTMSTLRKLSKEIDNLTKEIDNPVLPSWAQ